MLGIEQDSSPQTCRFVTSPRRLRLSSDDEKGRRHRARRGHAARQRRAFDLARSGRRRERHRLDPGVRRERAPGARRRRGEGLRRDARWPRRRRCGSSSATSCSRLGAATEAIGDAGLNGFDPARVGIVFGTAIGGVIGILEQEEVLRERGPERVSPNFLPNVLVDSASGQLAISLGIKGPNYAVVSACATGSHAIGEAAELIKRGDADAVLAGGARGLHAPADPRRLHCDARARRRGRAPAARVAAVRRHARRVRDGRGRVRVRPRGPRGGAGARRARSTPRCSATAPRTTPTTWRSPSRRRPASPT